MSICNFVLFLCIVFILCIVFFLCIVFIFCIVVLRFGVELFHCTDPYLRVDDLGGLRCASKAGLHRPTTPSPKSCERVAEGAHRACQKT